MFSLPIAKNRKGLTIINNESTSERRESVGQFAAVLIRVPGMSTLERMVRKVCNLFRLFSARLFGSVDHTSVAKQFDRISLARERILAANTG